MHLLLRSRNSGKRADMKLAIALLGYIIFFVTMASAVTAYHEALPINFPLHLIGWGIGLTFPLPYLAAGPGN